MRTELEVARARMWELLEESNRAFDVGNRDKSHRLYRAAERAQKEARRLERREEEVKV